VHIISTVQFDEFNTAGGKKLENSIPSDVPHLLLKFWFNAW